eukprot:754262-Hanusia_phi.AAC.1
MPRIKQLIGLVLPSGHEASESVQLEKGRHQAALLRLPWIVTNASPLVVYSNNRETDQKAGLDLQQLGRQLEQPLIQLISLTIIDGPEQWSGSSKHTDRA